MQCSVPFVQQAFVYSGGTTVYIGGSTTVRFSPIGGICTCMHPSCKFKLAILLEFVVEASLQHCTLHLPPSLDLMVVVDMPKLASPMEFLESTGTVIVLYISILIL